MDNQKANELLMKWPEFTKEFLNESDRSAVIFSCSLIDDLLGQILKAFFIEGDISKKLIYGENALLGDFTSRIQCLYALGLICKNKYADLNKLKELRNIFSNEWGDIDLGDEKMVKICRSMHNIRKDISPEVQLPRECFNSVIGVLFTQLSHIATITSHQQELVNQSS
ncbi:MAG: MltR family transcriptional regulator [Pseudomonadota bacterium]